MTEPDPMPESSPRLIIRENGSDRIFDLVDKEVQIGRSKENDIEVDDISSSRRHCRIFKSGAHWAIEDLQSRNGTIVNGILIRRHELQPGDCIEIGKSRVYFDRVPTPELPSGHEATETLLLSTEYFMEPLTEINESSQVELLQREREIFLRLLSIAKKLCGMHVLSDLLETILDTVLEITGAERGFLILKDDDEELKIRCSRNVDQEAVKRAELKVSQSISKWVLETARPVLIGDARADTRTREFHSVNELKLESVLCVPLQIRGKTEGLIYVDNRFESEAFQRPHLRFIEFLADQAGIFIDNAQLFEEARNKNEALRRAKEEAENLNRQFQELLLASDIKPKQVSDLVTRRPTRSFKFNYDNIITKSSKMFQIFEVLDRVIDTDIPVLVMGESGTGKELVAQAIHYQGARKEAGFVSQNCAAIPPNLLESEFFGHVKGAFTGAVAHKKGLFELASGGTLFLDEIGDMSLDLQTKLLRVLEEGEIRPVGGRDYRKVDVRVISATNRALKAMIENNEFREDLFYRLNVINITLPPLRERREDIPLLVDHFIDKTSRKAGRERPSLDNSALYQLYSYDWPGNVRELENEIARVCTLAEEEITTELLSPVILQAKGGGRGIQPQGTLKEIVTEATEELERRVIVENLTKTTWNKSRAAKLLGVSRPTLDQKIDKYGIKKPPK